MCDWKPGPRCFTHYEPRYNAAFEKYLEELENIHALAQEGELTDEDLKAFNAAFENYQAAQRMFYMSPKARKKWLGKEIDYARENYESAQKYLDENPNDHYAQLYAANAKAELDQLEKQAVDGAHRWDQAKLASELAARRNENALERGIFSQAAYTAEDLEDVDLNTWDRACPDGTVTLHGFEDELKKSSDPKIYREATITRKVRLELPTGERVHVDLQARIIQKKKGSSSYTVEYTVFHNGKNLGTLIPNSTAHDGFYGVGAVAERRPVTRDTADTARDGGRLRKTDWEHYQEVNELTDEELAEHKAAYEANVEAIGEYNNENKKGMYTQGKTFNNLINTTHKGQKHNNFTRQLLKDNNAHTSFNSISGAKNDIKKVLTNQDALLTNLVMNARTQSINNYAEQQFGASKKAEREEVERDAKANLETLDDRLKPKTRREKRNHGGGMDRTERNIARTERKMAQINKEKAATARREKTLNASNDHLSKIQQKTGNLAYSTRVDPTRQTADNGNYSYSATRTVKGGRKEYITIQFTKTGKLGKNYSTEPSKIPNMVAIKTPQKQTIYLSPGQYATMANTAKK